MSLFRHLVIGLVLLGLVNTANAQDVSFAGKWVGTWKNSLNENGNSLLVLKNDGGKFTGTWDDTVVTSGKRINKNTVELQAKSSEHTYQITATINDKGVMNLKYLATHKVKGSYTGEAKLEHKN